LIGSSDTHVAAGAFDESDYWSKVGMLDATPQRRGSVPLEQTDEGEIGYASGYFKYWSASGLAGVWAQSNTRESIYAALQRKETFATSGPRIRLRFFAGDFPQNMLEKAGILEHAYQQGVPMGGELIWKTLSEQDQGPAFLVWALGDPDSAPLQRLQLIKTWVEGGEARERVFDIACARGAPDPGSLRCASDGAKLDIETCEYDRSAGVAELRVLWRDPSFEPNQKAVYYARVLENPTCRWSTWDAIRTGVAPRADLPASIQERAWSSPIWYRPS
jgi:hypothetical protein